MHEAERALHRRVLQVEVELPQLRGGEHALVDEGRARQTREVHGLAARAVGTGTLVAEFVLNTLAHDECLALELHARRTGEEHLTEGRHRVAREGTESVLVGGYLAPAEHGQTLGLDDLLDALGGGRGVVRALRQEGDTGRVAALGGQFEVDNFTQEAVGDLDHDSGTVAGVRLCARSTTVLQVDQRGDRLVHDVAAATTMHIDYKRNTARVVFVGRVIEPNGAWSVLHVFASLGARRCAELSPVSSLTAVLPSQQNPPSSWADLG
ncbi:Uncharacterised protein [Mycobacteroides abscessus subsp. abscessus]|nr:Uncharacterised protein [Mycobacteroides abscessus subsp. abscessus]